MATTKPDLVLVSKGQPDRVFSRVERQPAGPKSSSPSPLGLDAEFLHRAARAAGAVAMAQAATSGLAVVGMRDGQPVVREADGSERPTTWADLGISTDL